MTADTTLYLDSAVRGVSVVTFAPGECSRGTLALGDFISTAAHTLKLHRVTKIIDRGVWALPASDPRGATPETDTYIRRFGFFLTFKGLAAERVVRVRVEEGFHSSLPQPRAFLTTNNDLVIARGLGSLWTDVSQQPVHLPVGAILHPLAPLAPFA